MKNAKILWIDLEMTGLHPSEDRILEVAAIATDWDFKEVATYESAVKVPKKLLEARMVGEFWETFTDDDQSPKVEGAIGLLFDSIEYFNNHSKQEFIWKSVELINNVELDNFQIELINRFKQSEFVERDEFMSELYMIVYGRNNNLASNALRTIGVTSTRKQINGKKVSGYIIGNRQRFDTFLDTETGNTDGLSNLAENQTNILTSPDSTTSKGYHIRFEELPF